MKRLIATLVCLLLIATFSSSLLARGEDDPGWQDLPEEDDPGWQDLPEEDDPGWQDLPEDHGNGTGHCFRFRFHHSDGNDTVVSEELAQELLNQTEMECVIAYQENADFTAPLKLRGGLCEVLCYETDE